MANIATDSKIKKAGNRTFWQVNAAAEFVQAGRGTLAPWHLKSAFVNRPVANRIGSCRKKGRLAREHKTCHTNLLLPTAPHRLVVRLLGGPDLGKGDLVARLIMNYLVHK